MASWEEHEIKLLARYAKTNGYKEWITGDPIRTGQNLAEIRMKLYKHPYWPKNAHGNPVPLSFVLTELYNATTTGKIDRPYANIASHMEALSKLLNGEYRKAIMERYYAKNPDKRPRPAIRSTHDGAENTQSLQRALDSINIMTGNKPETLAGKNEYLYQLYLELLERLKEQQNGLQ